MGRDSNPNEYTLARRDTLEFRYSRELYPKDVLIKAAFHFLDVAYVHLDCTDKEYIVQIRAKSRVEVDENEFDNEILSQLARHTILEQTKEVRTLTLARALGSSVVMRSEENDEIMQDSIPADSILKDWFES